MASMQQCQNRIDEGGFARPKQSKAEQAVLACIHDARLAIWIEVQSRGQQCCRAASDRCLEAANAEQVAAHKYSCDL